MSESGGHVQTLLYWGGNVVWNNLGEPGYDRNAGAIDVIQRDCTLEHLVERIFSITGVNQSRYLLKVSTVHKWVNGLGVQKARMIDLTDCTLPFFLNPTNGYRCLELYLDFHPIYADETHPVLDAPDIEHADGEELEEDGQGGVLRASPVTQKMPCIPSEVAREILLWVPAESLFRFRAVCKAWRCIIDDPCFVKSHSNNQRSSTTLLLKNKVNTHLYLISWDSLNYENKCQPVDVMPGKTLVHAGVYRLPDFPVSTCNGLILIPNYGPKKIWVICNPLTRDFHEVPMLPDAQECVLMGSGLGYDSVVDDYKVVRIDKVHRDGMFVRRTLVYSLKMDSWSKTMDCPCDFVCGIGVFVNGALHWRSRDHIVITALDIAAGTYQQLPLPPQPTDPELGILLYAYQQQSLPLSPTKYDIEVHLNVLDGFLAVCYSCRFKDRFIVWVMKENGTWTKLFSWSDFNFNGFYDTERPRPIACWKSKGQVLFETKHNFVWCDLADGSYKKVIFRGLLDFPSCSQNCPGSLFRLRSHLDGSVIGTRSFGVKRRRRKNTAMASARLKIYVTVGDWWCDHIHHPSSDSSDEDNQ